VLLSSLTRAPEFNELKESAFRERRRFLYCHSTCDVLQFFCSIAGGNAMIEILKIGGGSSMDSVK
jgi:hypothetical protein